MPASQFSNNPDSLERCTYQIVNPGPEESLDGRSKVESYGLGSKGSHASC